MVSLFGLKFGSDKKKNRERNGKRPVIQLTKTIEQNAFGEDQLFGTNDAYGGSYAASVHSVARPNTSRSYKLSPARPPKHALYSSDAQNLAASSMVDLSRRGHHQKSSFSSLKPAVSNPDLGMRWNNGSSSSLGPALPIFGSQTSTPRKSWIKPLDIHFGKAPLPPVVVRSPLGKRFSLEPSNDGISSTTNMKHLSQLPQPLKINKKKQPQPPASPPRSRQRSPPSPPRSVMAADDVESWPMLEKPNIPAAAEERPSSRGSHKNVNTGMTPLGNSSHDGTYGLPSPPLSLPRGSDETNNRANVNLWGEPIIQNVRAKRETMTISPTRRMSIERMVEELQQSATPALEQRPKTSSGPGGRREYRPRPPDLDLRTIAIDRNSPLASPYLMNQHTPVSNVEPPSRPARTGPPPAAVGAYGRPSRPNRAGVPRPAADAYGYPPGRPSEDGSSIYSMDLGLSQSPGSPVLPLSGPLASPRFMPPVEPPAEPVREEYDPDFRFPDWSALAEDAPPPKPVATAGSSARASPTNFDSPNWPLPAPGIGAGASAGRLTPVSSSLSPTIKTPSSFGVPSFSRPWTPNNARPNTPVKTADGSMISGLRRPPPGPRAPPPRVTPDYASTNPVVIDSSSRSGFI